jgi:hypothetical protein
VPPARRRPRACRVSPYGRRRPARRLGSDERLCPRALRGAVMARGSGGVVHDAVVGAAGAGAAGAGAAGAGALASEHLRGGPAVQFHQVPLGAAALEPGVAEVVPEPVRVHLHPALPARRAISW